MIDSDQLKQHMVCLLYTSLEVQIEEAEEMEVDIFSDDLVNGNEAGRNMNVDPTELLESVADTPEQQQLSLIHI